MNVMDDTLADESGIPFLSNADDIPVHSTPIKGEKIPLPSTKNAMKHFMGQPGRHDDFSEVDSLMSIRYSDVHQGPKGKDSAKKGHTEQGFDQQRLNDRKNYEQFNDRKHFDRNTQDLSNLDNLRPKMKDHPPEKAFHHERSRSPKPHHRSKAIEHNERYMEPRNLEQNHVFKRPTSPEQNGLSKRPLDKFSVRRSYDDKDPHFVSSYNLNKRSENKDIQTKSYRGTNEDDLDGYNIHRRTHLSQGQTRVSTEINTRFDSNDKDFSSKDKFDKNDEKEERLVNRQNEEVDRRKELKDRINSEPIDSSVERKRVTFNSPRYGNVQGTGLNRSATSKQNTSLSELENTTLQKQRQEIQLLMSELKDRDRELSDMMKSHQQQLVAWQQDRDRLGTLERKCTQYEDELRAKTNQLRSTVTNLKALKSTDIEHQHELKEFKSMVETLNAENKSLKDELSQMQTTNENLQENLTGLSTKVGKLEAREEELTTSLRLKEKDISSATGHMRELSERLQQLDLRCKECQDREKEAVKDKEEWKKKYEQTREDFHTVTAELDCKRKDVVRLSEENKSARQQLALLGKEASMRERCQEELIESMRVKQERTDTQLRNLRELYDRQVKEVASLQMQLDNSKELIYRQQNSIDDQQLSTSSYQGRGSHASEYSLERSSASHKTSWQRHKSSPSSKARESDVTGSHYHTQSSGYQSQLSENQSAPVANGAQSTASSDNNYTNMTGSQRQTLNAGFQSQLYENQSVPGASNNHTNSTGSRLQETTQHSQNHFRTGPSANQSVKYATGSQNTADTVRDFSNSTGSKQPVKKHYPPEYESQSAPKSTESYKHDSTEDQNRGHLVYNQSNDFRVGENYCDINERNAKQSNQLVNESSFHTPPRLKKMLDFDSPVRKDGYVIEHSQYKVSISSSVKDESRNPIKEGKNMGTVSSDPGKIDAAKDYFTLPNQGQGHSEERMPSRDHGHSGESALNQGQGHLGQIMTNRGQGHRGDMQNQGQSHSGDMNGANSFSGQLNSVIPQNTEQVANYFGQGPHAIVDKEFEKQYTFENKLTSFLEELDDIDDDSIWDEKPSKSFNLSLPDSSPANKLRKLLLESQEMIHSLERSAESPRQSKIREQHLNNEQKPTVDTADENKQPSA